MPLSELERKRIEKTVDAFVECHRPPAHLRDQVDLGYRTEGQSVLLFELRPVWGDSTRTLETPIAKTTLVKNSGAWKIFWLRSDLAWHRYDPKPEASSLEEALGIIGADEHACFFG